MKLKVEQDGEEIALMTYRYPVPEGVARKGIVFYIHGFGAYCEHVAFIFKQFAEKGYEAFAMDQRGFGNSGGHRGLYEGSDQAYGDIFLFISKVVEKYKIN